MYSQVLERGDASESLWSNHGNLIVTQIPAKKRITGFKTKYELCQRVLKGNNHNLKHLTAPEFIPEGISSYNNNCVCGMVCIDAQSPCKLKQTSEMTANNPLALCCCSCLDAHYSCAKLMRYH